MLRLKHSNIGQISIDASDSYDKVPIVITNTKKDKITCETLRENLSFGGVFYKGKLNYVVL